MTAANAKASEYEQLIERLKSAAWDLSSAADDARDAVEALDPATTEDAHTNRELAEAVRLMHDDTHEGPIRWCRHDACQKAEQILS